MITKQRREAITMMMITMMVVVIMAVVIMTMIFCNFSVLQISFLCYYLEHHVKFHYLNVDIDNRLRYFLVN